MVDLDEGLVHGEGAEENMEAIEGAVGADTLESRGETANEDPGGHQGDIGRPGQGLQASEGPLPLEGRPGVGGSLAVLLVPGGGVEGAGAGPGLLGGDHCSGWGSKGGLLFFDRICDYKPHLSLYGTYS